MYTSDNLNAVSDQAFNVLATVFFAVFFIAVAIYLLKIISIKVDGKASFVMAISNAVWALIFTISGLINCFTPVKLGVTSISFIIMVISTIFVFITFFACMIASSAYRSL